MIKETDERPFGILVLVFWSYVKNQYCIDKNGTTIQLIESNEDECNSSELRTLEILRKHFCLNFSPPQVNIKFSASRSGTVGFCGNSSEYSQISVIKKMLEYEGSQECFLRKFNVNLLECNGLYNCSYEDEDPFFLVNQQNTEFKDFDGKFISN